MEDILIALHSNRDENSFTARFFEHLIGAFQKNNNTFNEFVEDIKKSIERCNKIHGLRLETPELKGFSFLDGIPFVENLDLYAFCKNKDEYKKKLKLNKTNVDKTEFDYIIACKKDDKIILLVFEVKCFTDLKEKEIIRQNKLLSKYKSIKLFDEFHHFALISEDNLINGIVPKRDFKGAEHFNIISWEDLRDYIPESRFKIDIEFGSLYKTVHRNGTYSNKRSLIVENNKTNTKS